MRTSQKPPERITESCKKPSGVVQPQTWIYVFSAAHGVKIGITRTGLDQRRYAIQCATGLPVAFEAAWDCGDLNPYRVEARAHHLLADCRLLGEWFACSVEFAIDAVERAFTSGNARLPLREEPLPPERRSPGRPRRDRAGTPVHAVRRFRRLGLRHLEEMTGINRATWSLIENGKMLPEPRHIAALSAALDVPYEQWRLRVVLELADEGGVQDTEAPA